VPNNKQLLFKPDKAAITAGYGLVNSPQNMGVTRQERLLSYIDRIDHEHVGFFAGLPVYRPLESYVPEETLDGEFSCTPDSLVLGGGYLEHPGMVIRDLNYAAAQYISDWINHCEEHKCSIYTDEETDDWIGIAHDYMFGKDEHLVFDCIHWSMRDYSEFYSDCKSRAMNSPFAETQRRNEFESWLISNFGELVIFSYPELVTDIGLREIMGKINMYLFGNLLILPPGYPTDHLGRVYKNGESIQGNRAWKVVRNV